MAKGRERRKEERKRARVRVRFWNEEEQLEGSGLTSDLSESGMFIETKTSVSLDTRLHLELDLESGPHQTVGVVARILRASRSVQPVIKAGFGVRVLGLLEAMKRAEPEPLPEIEIDGLHVDLRRPGTLEAVFMRDIKRGGLHVLTDDPPEPESIATVRLVLPDPHEAIDVDGTVIKVTTNPPGAALQLLEVDALRARLAEIITS